jgi:hypothetical protein
MGSGFSSPVMIVFSSLATSAPRLDRLARSTAELLRIAEGIAEKDAGLQSLEEPWADTTTPAGRMVLTVFAGVAEFGKVQPKYLTIEGNRRTRVYAGSGANSRQEQTIASLCDVQPEAPRPKLQVQLGLERRHVAVRIVPCGCGVAARCRRS